MTVVVFPVPAPPIKIKTSWRSCLGTSAPELVDGNLAIAQGNSANGNDSTSHKMFNTAQQLLIDISEVNKVNSKDTDGDSQVVEGHQKQKEEKGTVQQLVGKTFPIHSQKG